MNPPDLNRRLAVRQYPKGRQPVMYQKWRDLLFLHWTCSPEEIQNTLPEGLFVDTFNSQAFVGIIPFFVRGARPRFLPGIPGISNFLELNVRTYVYDRQGVPGVWFYSLDAGPVDRSRQLVVTAARLTYFLPYHLAAMSAKKASDSGSTDEIHYTCRRAGARMDMESSFRYSPEGEVFEALPGTLDFFLIERYILFSRNPQTGKLFSGQVHHQPYPLLKAQVPEWDTRMLLVDGLNCQGESLPVHIVMSKGVDVKVFAPQASKK